MPDRTRASMTPAELRKMAEVLRGVAKDGEAILAVVACTEPDCVECGRKWETVRVLREAAEYLDSQAVVH